MIKEHELSYTISGRMKKEPPNLILTPIHKYSSFHELHMPFPIIGFLSGQCFHILQDIQIKGVNRDEKKIEKAKIYPNSRHFLTYQHSLRVNMINMLCIPFYLVGYFNKV